MADYTAILAVAVILAGGVALVDTLILKRRGAVRA